MNTNVVVIPLQRYEELLDIETRVDVAVERINNNKYIHAEDVLRILGTEFALEIADEIKKENEKERIEFEKKMSQSK